MMNVHSPNPNGKDVEKARLMQKCNDSMIIMNKATRIMVRIRFNMKAPDAEK
jgi:hypothetical protein